MTNVSTATSARPDRRCPARRRGFTLVELLPVIVLIGSLIAIVLPAFKQASAAARRTAAVSNAKWVILGVLIYENEHDGSLPADVGLVHPYLNNESLIQNLTANRYDDGLADYVYLYPPVEPERYRGFDGTETSIESPAETAVIFGKMRNDSDRYLVAYADGHVKLYAGTKALPQSLDPDLLPTSQTPSLLAQSAYTTRALAAQLQSLDPSRDVLPGLVASLRGEQTLRSVFNLLDTDHDGQLRIDEAVNHDISGYSGEFRPMLASFLDQMRAELMPGAAPDGSFSLNFDEFQAAARGGLFSFNTARSLTTEFVARAGVARSLNAKLDAAETAGQRGQARVKSQLLGVYLNELDVQTGTTVTPDQAETLAFILRGL